MSLNAFWFQGVPFEGTDPSDPRPDVLRDVAEALEKLSPDVLCLQEVQSQRAFEAVREAFDALPHAAYASGAVFPQYGVVTLSRDPITVIAATSDVQPPPQRAFLAVRVGSLVVANVHLPSGRLIGKNEARTLRVDELTRLLRACGRVDVWLGDTNDPPGGAVDVCSARHGFRDAAVLTAGEELPTNASGTFRGDRISVSADLASALEAYAVLPAHRFHTHEGRSLSDHLPLWIDLAL